MSLGRSRILACLLLACLVRGLGAAPVVLLDPGHGGSDAGVTADGFRESDFCLALAKRMLPLLRARGIDARLTRDSDVDLSSGARVALANALQPVALLSLHANAAYQAGARGPRLFVPAEAKQVDLPEAPPWGQAAGMHAAASRTLGLILARALGVTGPHPVQTLKLALFRGLSVPACLVEVEFATNPAGLAALKDDAQSRAWAARLSSGVAAYVLPAPASAPAHANP